MHPKHGMQGAQKRLLTSEGSSSELCRPPPCQTSLPWLLLLCAQLHEELSEEMGVFMNKTKPEGAT